jgi:hypothetical protein
MEHQNAPFFTGTKLTSGDFSCRSELGYYISVGVSIITKNISIHVSHSLVALVWCKRIHQFMSISVSHSRTAKIYNT